MEERLCLTDEMLGILSSLKGKILKSYEGDLGHKMEYAFGVLIINTGSIVVPVIRVLEPMMLFGEEDERAPLECYVRDLDKEYNYTGKKSAKKYLVSERIVSVKVVRDRGSWPEGGSMDSLVEDEGIIIRTSNHVLALYIDESEGIYVKFADVSAEEDLVPGIEFFWRVDKFDDLVVEREIIEL